MHKSWKQLNQSIVDCDACPRLRKHCQDISQTKRKAYRDFDYWGKPVPNFGPARSPLLIVGLAPGAHGANRTGRMFTGDRSGDWLYRALHKAGMASQPESQSLNDGLKLRQCAITSVCHCAPPDNKPARDEVSSCRIHLLDTIRLSRPLVFLALGQLAWNAIIDFAVEQTICSPPRPKFGHGATTEFSNGQHLVGSYHPSQQNTFTGRLTEEMLDSVIAKSRKLADL